MSNTKESNKEILDMMYELLGKLKLAKSQTDKGDVARVYSVCITLMEQVLSYFKVWVIGEIYFPTKYEE